MYVNGCDEPHLLLNDICNETPAPHDTNMNKNQNEYMDE